jgi:hypothetical protein
VFKFTYIKKEVRLQSIHNFIIHVAVFTYLIKVVFRLILLLFFIYSMACLCVMWNASVHP